MIPGEFRKEALSRLALTQDRGQEEGKQLGKKFRGQEKGEEG